MIHRHRTVASSQDDLHIKVSNQTNIFGEGTSTGPHGSYVYHGEKLDFQNQSMLSRSFSDYNLRYSTTENLPPNQGSVVNPWGQRPTYSNTTYVAVPMQQVPIQQAPVMSPSSAASALTRTPTMDIQQQSPSVGSPALSRTPVMEIQPQKIPQSGGTEVFTRTYYEFSHQSRPTPNSPKASNLTGTCPTIQPLPTNASISASNLATSWPTVDFTVPPPTLLCKDKTFQLQAKDLEGQIKSVQPQAKDFIGEIYIGYQDDVQTPVKKEQAQSERDNFNFGDVDLRQCQFSDASANQSVKGYLSSHDHVKDEDLRIEQTHFDKPKADTLVGNPSGNSLVLPQETVGQDFESRKASQVMTNSILMSGRKKGDENNNSWFPYTLDEINENNFQSVPKPSSIQLNGKGLSRRNDMHKSGKYIEGPYIYTSDQDSIAALNDKEINLLERRSEVLTETQMSSGSNFPSGCESIDFGSLIIPPPPPLPDVDPPATPPLPVTAPPPPPPHELLQNMKSQQVLVEPSVSMKTTELCLSSGSNLVSYPKEDDFANYHFNMFLNPRNHTEYMKDVTCTDPESKDHNDKTIAFDKEKENSKESSCVSPFCEFWKKKVKAARDGKEDKLQSTFRECAQKTGTKINKAKPVSKKYPDSLNKTRLPKWKLPGTNELNTDIIRVINAKLKRTKEFLEKRLNNPSVSDTDSQTVNATSKSKPQLGSNKIDAEYIDLTKGDTTELATRKVTSPAASRKKLDILTSTGSILSQLKSSVARSSKPNQKSKNKVDKTKTAKIEYFKVGKEHKTLLKPHADSGNRKEKSNLSMKDNEIQDKDSVPERSVVTKDLAMRNKQFIMMKKSNLMKENISSKLKTKDSLKSRKPSGPVQALKAKLPENVSVITEVKDHKKNITSKPAVMKSPLLINEKCDTDLCQRKGHVKEVQFKNTKTSEHVLHLDSTEKMKGSSGIKGSPLKNRNQNVYENEQPVPSIQESKEKSERCEDDVVQNVLTAKRWLKYRADAIQKIQDSYTPHAVAKKPKRVLDNLAHATLLDSTADKSSSKETVVHPSTEAVCQPRDNTSEDEFLKEAVEKGPLPVQTAVKCSPVTSRTDKEKESPIVKATTLTSVNPYTSYMNSPHTPVIPTDSSYSNAFEWKSWRTGPDIFSLDYLKSLGNFRTDFGVVEGKKHSEQTNPNLVKSNDFVGKDACELKETPETDKTSRLVICEEVFDDKTDMEGEVDICEVNEATHVCIETEESENNYENTGVIIKDTLTEEFDNVIKHSDNDTKLVSLPSDEEKQEACGLSHNENRSKQHSLNVNRWSEKECLKISDRPLFDPCFKRILRLPIDPLYKTEFIDPILNSSTFDGEDENHVVDRNEMDEHNADMLAEQDEPLDLRVKSFKTEKDSLFDKTFLASSSVQNVTRLKDACCQTTNYEIVYLHSAYKNDNTFDDSNPEKVKDDKIFEFHTNLEKVSDDKTFELDSSIEKVMYDKTLELDTILEKVKDDKTGEIDIILEKVNGDKAIELDTSMQKIKNDETFELDPSMEKVKDDEIFELYTSVAKVKDEIFELDTSMEKVKDDDIFELYTSMEKVKEYKTGVFDTILEKVNGDKTFELDTSMEKVKDDEIFELYTSMEKVKDDEIFELYTSMEKVKNDETFELDTGMEKVKDDEIFELYTSMEKVKNDETFELDTGMEKVKDDEIFELDTSMEKVKDNEIFELDTSIEKVKDDETCEPDTSMEKVKDDETFELDSSMEKVKDNETCEHDTSMKKVKDFETSELDISMEKVKDDETCELNISMEKVKDNETFELDISIEKVKDYETCELDISMEKVKDYETFELDTSIEKVTDDKKCELDTNMEMVKEDTTFEFDTNLEMVMNDKTCELDNNMKKVTEDKTFEFDTKVLEVNEEVSVCDDGSELDKILEVDANSKKIKSTFINATITSAEAELPECRIDENTLAHFNRSDLTTDVCSIKMITDSVVSIMTGESFPFDEKTPVEPYGKISKDSFHSTADLLDSIIEGIRPATFLCQKRKEKSAEDNEQTNAESADILVPNSKDDIDYKQSTDIRVPKLRLLEDTEKLNEEQTIDNSGLATELDNPITELQQQEATEGLCNTGMTSESPVSVIESKVQITDSQISLPLKIEIPSIDMIQSKKVCFESTDQHEQHLPLKSQSYHDDRTPLSDFPSSIDKFTLAKSSEISRFPDQLVETCELEKLKSEQSCEPMHIHKDSKEASSDTDNLKLGQSSDLDFPNELQKDSVYNDVLSSEKSKIEDSTDLPSTMELLNARFCSPKTESTRDSSKDVMQLNDELNNDLWEHIKETDDDRVSNTQHTLNDKNAITDYPYCVKERLTNELPNNAVISDCIPPIYADDTKDIAESIRHEVNKNEEPSLDEFCLHLDTSVDESSLDDFDPHIDTSSDDMSCLGEQQNNEKTYELLKLQRGECDKVLSPNEKNVFDVLKLESNEIIDNHVIDWDQLSDSVASNTEKTESFYCKLTHKTEVQMDHEEIELNVEDFSKKSYKKEETAKQVCETYCDLTENDRLDERDIKNNTEQLKVTINANKSPECFVSPELPTLVSNDDIDNIVTGLQDELDDSSENNQKQIKKGSPSIPVLLPEFEEENRTLSLNQVIMEDGTESGIVCLGNDIEVEIEEENIELEGHYSDEHDMERKLRKNVLTLNENGCANMSQIYNKQKADKDETAKPIQDESHCKMEKRTEKSRFQSVTKNLDETSKDETVKPIQDKCHCKMTSRTEKNLFQSAEKCLTENLDETSKDETVKPIQDKSHCKLKTVNRTERGLFQSAEKFLTENFDETSKRKCRKRMSLNKEESVPKPTGLKKKTKLKRFAVTIQDRIVGGKEITNIDVVGNIDVKRDIDEEGDIDVEGDIDEAGDIDVAESGMARQVSIKRKAVESKKDPTEKKLKHDQ